MNFGLEHIWPLVAARQPGRTVAICDDSSLTWGQLQTRVNHLLSALDAAQCTATSVAGPDSAPVDSAPVYAMYAQPRIEAVEVVCAAALLGGEYVGLNPRQTGQALINAVCDSGANVLFFQSCYAMRIWEVQSQLENVKLFVQIDDGTEALMSFAQDYERSLRDHAAAALDAGSLTNTVPSQTTQSLWIAAHLQHRAGALGVSAPADLAEYEAFLKQISFPPVHLVASDFIDAAAVRFGFLGALVLGGVVLMSSRPDGHRLLALAEQHRVEQVFLANQMMAQALQSGLADAVENNTPYDLRDLQSFLLHEGQWSQDDPAQWTQLIQARGPVSLLLTQQLNAQELEDLL